MKENNKKWVRDNWKRKKSI